jgi:hypothetical protein
MSLQTKATTYTVPYAAKRINLSEQILARKIR